MSSFLNCLIFPKTVSHQKTSNRHSQKGRDGANVDSCAAQCLDTYNSQDALVPCQRWGPNQIFTYNTPVTTDMPILIHPVDSIRRF